MQRSTGPTGYLFIIQQDPGHTAKESTKVSQGEQVEYPWLTN